MSLTRRVGIPIVKGILWTLRRVDHYFLGSSALRSDADFRRDPYPSFEAIRHAPIVRSLANTGWIILGYEAVQEALRDTNLSNDLNNNPFYLRVARAASGGRPIPFVDNPPLLNLDPPAHTPLRRAISRRLTRGFVDALTPEIEDSARALVSRMVPPCDLIETLAEPLPVQVIADILGVHNTDQLAQWSHRMTNALRIAEADQVQDAADAEASMRCFVAKQLPDMLKINPESPISQLAQDPEVQERDVISTCVLLLTAGHETTTRLIANTIYILHDQRSVREAVVSGNLSLDNLIDEVLRLEPPVQMTLRFVRRRTTIAGRSLKPGQLVLINFAAANRDPAVFDNADRFEPGRNRPHLSFGYGIHLCLGAALAKLEARIAIKELLVTYPDFELHEPISWGNNQFFRGPETLTILT
ncbi:MAG: cytochrome P450 [Pseudomonadota bacterium]|nr:cytochrome P450 [Pseudomonadota bacterium]